jgi:hypothetical protein
MRKEAKKKIPIRITGVPAVNQTQYLLLYSFAATRTCSVIQL